MAQMSYLKPNQQKPGVHNEKKWKCRQDPFYHHHSGGSWWRSGKVFCKTVRRKGTFPSCVWSGTLPRSSVWIDEAGPRLYTRTLSSDYLERNGSCTSGGNEILVFLNSPAPPLRPAIPDASQSISRRPRAPASADWNEGARSGATVRLQLCRFALAGIPARLSYQSLQVSSERASSFGERMTDTKIL